jgi:quinol monooxygenase YgiN
MVAVIVHHRVADYDIWRREFDHTVEGADATNLSYQVWRGQDDPNLVIVANTFESRKAAEAVMNSPALREAMARGGVIASSVRIDFVDEVTSEAASA